MLENSGIRIIPVLVIVAMMAFSIRLVDFATGVSSLSGKAFAESKPEPADSSSAPSDAALKTPENPKEAEKIAQAAQPQEKSGQGEKGEAAPQAAAAKKGEANPKTPAEPASSKEAVAKDKPEEKPAEIRWRDASDEEPELQGVKKEVFDDLAGRRKELDKREQALATREALLKAAEQELGTKYQELAQLRSQIEALLEKQSTEEQARVASLVKIYENMKPKEAARIFDTLDLDVLVSVVSKMSERRLSPILAAMNPERARTVTIMLSEEKQLPSLPQEKQ